MKQAFKNCVVIVNPAGTNYQRAERFIKRLEQYFPKTRMKLVDISVYDEQRNEELISKVAKYWTKRTLICVAGGDGTVSMLVNRLLTLPGIPASAQKAVILPMWGGNANDLAYMANGPVFRISLRQILSEGKPVPVYPLAVSIKNNEHKVRLAINYVSFGASAYAAKKINDLGHSRSWLRLLIETATVVGATFKSKRFSAEISGKKTKVYDLILINGSRIAKVYRAPNRLTDRAFFELTLHRKHPYFASLLRGLARRHNKRTAHSLTVHESTWIQIDGEALQLPSHTEISVKPADKAFYVLSTKLK